MSTEQILDPSDQPEARTHLSNYDFFLLSYLPSLCLYRQSFTKLKMNAIMFPTNSGAGWAGPWPEKNIEKWNISITSDKW